jgi:diguanylate cyclase (GGDEF)-like protein
MALDIRTLIIATALVAVLLGAVALHVAYQSRLVRRTMLAWGGALLTAAAGIGAVALRGAIPDFLSIVVANTLVVAAAVISYRGLNRYLDRDTADPVGWAAVLATFAGFAALTYAWPTLHGRIALVSATMALLLGRNALLLRRHAVSTSLASLNFAAGVFGLAAVLMLVRAVAEPALVSDTGMAGGLDLLEQSDARRAATYLAFIVVIAMLTAAVFWMELQATQAALFRLATTDPVTGIPNRVLYLDRLAQALAQARRNGTLVAVMFIDLDRFKTVNDTHGHDVGDNVLRLVAERVRETVRGSDTEGRLGGDEMGVVLAPLGKQEDAERVAAKLAARLMQPLHPRGLEIPLSASIGVALFPRDGADPESLLRNADAAMYHAKKHGSAKFEFYGAA